MSLGFTPTIAICLTAAAAGGIALARPDTQPPPATSEYEYDSGSGYDYSPAPAGGSSGVAAADQPVEVSIESFAFSGIPAVAPGTTLVVTNLDAAPHTLTSNDGLFSTGILNQGESATVVVPAEPGAYGFFCEVHPAMEGTLTVES